MAMAVTVHWETAPALFPRALPQTTHLEGPFTQKD